MLDRTRLAAIAQGGRTSQFQVLAAFRRANSEDSQKLGAAWRAGDFEHMATLAHRIEGACMMLGAMRLAGSCSRLAMAGRAGGLAQAQAAHGHFDRELQALDDFLDTFPDDGTPVAQSDRVQDAELCKNLRFLVAEDHDFQRLLMKRLLLRLGASDVQEACDGASALRILEAGAPPVDILLLDFNMPGMDGIELIRLLGRSKQRVAVILNSALSPSLLQSLSREAATHDVRLLGVVSKPLTTANIAAMVNIYRTGQHLKPL